MSPNKFLAIPFLSNLRVSVQYYTSPLHFITVLYRATTILFQSIHRLDIALLYYSFPLQDLSSPFQCFTTPFHASPTQHTSLLYFTFPLPRYAKLLFTVPTRILSLLCLCNTHHRLAGLFRRIAFLSYASPKQINTYPFHTFALPIITTISHAVAYSAISVHLKRPLPEFRH